MVLDATVFHPQGGGQPADTGVISAGGARFLVEDVRAKDGVVSMVSLPSRKAANLSMNHAAVAGILIFLFFPPLSVPHSSCDCTQVFHYGRFEGTEQGCGTVFKEGETVSLQVDAERRSFNSR